MAQTFWLALTVACLGWYLAVTAYVAVRGWRDIREMLARLREGQRGAPGGPEE
jgi:hypothetical protein